MSVQLFEQSLEPYALLLAHESQLQPGSYGATASFVGSMRDFNEGATVEGMFLEHYPGMTERELEAIERRAREQWDLLDVLIAHRVGQICPSDPIVLVAVWSAHRAAAFAACRSIMEDLKHNAPFWKRETLSTGQNRWVESNTPG